jgi:hypothetical protein
MSLKRLAWIRLFLAIQAAVIRNLEAEVRRLGKAIHDLGTSVERERRHDANGWRYSRLIWL